VLVFRLASYVLCGSRTSSDLAALYLLTMTHASCMYWIGGNAGVYIGAAAGANGKCLRAQPQGGRRLAHPPPPSPAKTDVPRDKKSGKRAQPQGGNRKQGNISLGEQDPSG
jgi:hypothetical protein